MTIDKSKLPSDKVIDTQGKADGAPCGTTSQQLQTPSNYETISIPNSQRIQMKTDDPYCTTSSITTMKNSISN